MKRPAGLALLSWLALGGCAPTSQLPPSPPPAAPPPGQVVPVTPRPAPPEVPPPGPAPKPAPPAAAAATVPPADAPATPVTATKASKPRTSASASRPAPSPAKALPAQPSATPASAAPAAAPVTASRPEPKPASPSLDLAALEQRLRDTKAIGVFTKLSLKNQVDDLLDQVRSYHQSAAKASQSAIRQQFEGLMLKVLASLQNGDPQLATAIATSRESLWGILMDPVKFSKI